MQGESSILLEIANRKELPILGTNLLLFLINSYPWENDDVPLLHREETSKLSEKLPGVSTRGNGLTFDGNQILPHHVDKMLPGH